MKNNNSLIFVDQILVSGSNFLLGILLARYLGIEMYGKYVLLWLIVLFCSSIQLSFIIAPMLTLGSKKSNNIRNMFLSTMFYLQLATVLIFMIFIFLFLTVAPYFEPSWEIGSLKYLIIIVTSIFLVQDFLRRFLIIKLKYLNLIFIDLIAYGGQFLIFGGLLWLDTFNLNSVFLAIIITFGFSSIIGITMINYNVFNLKYTKLVLVKNWKFSKWLVYSSFLQWGGGNYFIVVCGLILGSTAVGGIRSIQNIMGILHVVFISFENILPISFSKIYREEGIKSLILKFKYYLFYGLASFVLLILILNPLRNLILEYLFGSQYVQYSYLLVWFLIIYLFIYFGTLLRHVLRTVENTKIIFQSYIINFAFSLITAHYLISNFDVLGVVYGMIVQQISMNVMMIFSFKKLKRKLIN